MASMLDGGFVPTLSDSDDVVDEVVETTRGAKRKPAHEELLARKRVKSGGDVFDREEDGDVASDFEFDPANGTATLGDFDGWSIGAIGVNDVADAVDDIVAKRRQKTSAGDVGDLEVNEEVDDDNSEFEDDEDAINVEDEERLFKGTADDKNGHGHVFEEDREATVDDDDEEEEEEEEEEEDGNGDVDERDADDEAVHKLETAGENGDDGDAGHHEEHTAVLHPVDLENSPDARDAEEDDAEEDDAEELQKQKTFFADEDEAEIRTSVDSTFGSMNLSRPILKALAEVGFTSPTPIQTKTIPIALEGKDIVGGAVTGSGKTAAFLIPILERLLYRPKRVATTRVAVLMPTRELALQCLTVAKKLAAYTDVTFGRAIGGLNVREQEKELKVRPDVVVATPGRFIDFMRNSPAFQYDKIEILVLDEADRMLEEGFSDELNEILKTIPTSRQTMLFSATMTSRVDDLIRVGLQRPVRLMVDARKATTSGLVQEFVRLRPGRESKRLGYLMHLCSVVHTDRVIIFFRQKKEVHRVRILFALCDLQAAELHGSMSQEQRIRAIEAFRSGRASFLLATDLASRGLDIKGIETVINYEAPQSHDIYLHRVGRTARAGRKGVSCTLAAEPDRKVVKAAVKSAKAQGAAIRQRTVSPADADAWQARCDALADEVEAVLREEKEEKAMQVTERVIQRAENVVQFEQEIKSRPKKTWFSSEKEKQIAKKKSANALNGPDESEGRKKEKVGKLSNKKKKRFQSRDERKDGALWKRAKGVKVAGTGKKGWAKNKNR